MSRIWGVFTLGFMILLAGCGDSPENEFIDRMDKEHKGDVPVENEAKNLGQNVEVSGQEVTYATVNGEEITGYMAKPDGVEDAPGIIVIHEW